MTAATYSLQPFVQANIRYWLAACDAGLDDAALAWFDQERENLWQAIEQGLQLAGSAGEAASLVAHLFPLVERRGYWPAWIPILKQALVGAAGQPDLAFQLRNQLGFAYRLDRQLPAAVAIHQAVAAEATAAGCLLEAAEAHFHLGNAHLENHAYAEAEANGRAAWQLYRQLGLDSQPRKMAAVQNLLGQVAQAGGDYETAAACLTQAVAGWRQAGDDTYLARSLINLGRTWTAAGRYEQALTVLDQAIAVLEQTGSELDKTRAYLSRGVAYYQLADWPLAERAFRQTNSAYLQRSGNAYLQAYLYNNLGHVLFKQGELAEAATVLRAAVPLWQTAGDSLMEGNTLGALAEVLAAGGETAAAIASYSQAIERLQPFSQDAWASKRLQECRAQQAALFGEQKKGD